MSLYPICLTRSKKEVQKAANKKRVYLVLRIAIWETLLLLLLLLVASVVSDSVQPHRQTAAHQAPLSLGFSRQEHWSGLPFPSPMHESEK